MQQIWTTARPGPPQEPHPHHRAPILTAPPHRSRPADRRSRRGVQAHVPAEADHDVHGVDPGWECRLPGMATHPLRRLEVRRFGPLSEADLNFSSGINVVVGDNDAGKSQLLRLLYACTAVASSKSARSRDVSTRASQRTAIASKLVGVFKPDFLGRLVTRARRRSRAEVLLAFEGIDEPIAFDFASNARSEVQVKAFPRAGIDETPVFLPSHELLAVVPGLAALYDGYDVSFDETWRDTAELLARPAIKGDPGAGTENIMAPIRKLLGGSIEDSGDGRFVLKRDDGVNYEGPLVSEGLRKLGMISVLVANGTLRGQGYLLWDEPEANLNPASIRALALALAGLASRGTQVFLATHSLFLLRELQMLDEAGDADIRFIGMGRSDSGEVSVQDVDDINDLDVITALEAEIEQSARYLRG